MNSYSKKFGIIKYHEKPMLIKTYVFSFLYEFKKFYLEKINCSNTTLTSINKEILHELLELRRRKSLLSVSEERQYQLIKFLKTNFSFAKRDLIDPNELNFALNADEKIVYFLDKPENRDLLYYFPETYKTFYIQTRDFIEIFENWFENQKISSNLDSYVKLKDNDKLKSIDFQLDNLLSDDEEDIIYDIVKRKKLTYIKDKCLKVNPRLCDNVVYNLNDLEKRKLQHISIKARKIITDISCVGRSIEDLIYISYLYFIKKEIFLYINNSVNDFQILKPLLKLHEILLKIVYKIPSSTRRYFSRAVINNAKFCVDNLKFQIMFTPDEILRSKFYLSKFAFADEISKNFLEKIKLVLSKMSGKDFKGILGGIIYLQSTPLGLGLTQQEIASVLNITEVTLRSRTRELRLL